MNAAIDVAGWTLLTFVWQGAVLGGLAAAALRFAHRAPATVRYGIACAAMMAMLAAPLITLWSLRMTSTAATDVRSAVPRAPSSTRAASPLASGFALESAPRPAPLSQRPLPQRWFPTILSLWSIGVLILTARTLVGWRRVRRLQAISLASRASRWQRSAERLALRLDVRRVVHVAECTLVDVPAIVGWVRPVIVLPLAALANLTPSQVDAILAHELAHIRRHDYLVNLLQTVAETLLFYHPAVWWVSAQIRVEREHCCDDVALRVCGDAVEYAEALAEMESRRTVNGLALAATGGSLLLRIQRILGVTTPPAAVASTPWVVGPTLALLLTATAATLAQVSPPASPAAPQAPAPPAPSAATAQAPDFDLSTDREFRMRSHDVLRNLEIRGRGAMTFSDDLADIVAMADRAYLTIRERNWFTIRTIEVRGERGGVTRRFFVSGLERSWEPEGRQWLADRLPSLVRRSGLAAAARTRRILSTSGVDGVLDEIRQLESDYVRRLYFQELLKAPSINTSLAARIVAVAGEVIRSDFELRQTLAAAVPMVAADAVAARAYVDATASISSDFEHRQALDALSEAGGLNPGVMEAIAQSAAMISSDFEKRQALTGLLKAPTALTAGQGKAVLDAAATIRSDFECATLLVAFAEANTLQGPLAAPFFAAVGTIDSDFERGRVLKSLVRRQPLATDVLQGLLRSVGGMGSDFEQAEVLLSVVKAHPIDGATRETFIAAADSIHSDHEQGRVFAALVRAERR